MRCVFNLAGEAKMLPSDLTQKI